MGQTITKLSFGELTGSPIFKTRFCVEICEKVHTHYRNVRFVNSLHDWVNMAEGFKDALDRWKRRGCPGTGQGVHIELCRKSIINEVENKTIAVNLNKNLYVDNEGRIFAEGADFKDDTYIHLKIGDIRIELSKEQFTEVANAIGEAKKRLEDSNIAVRV